MNAQRRKKPGAPRTPRCISDAIERRYPTHEVRALAPRSGVRMPSPRLPMISCASARASESDARAEASGLALSFGVRYESSQCAAHSSWSLRVHATIRSVAVGNHAESRSSFFSSRFRSSPLRMPT